MMELLKQVSQTQFLFPVAAVAVVLVCAALVFMFGFHTAEQPQFDKLPLVVDDRKSSNKKRKTKEKKASPNRILSNDSKVKNEGAKKSPSNEKKEEKSKEPEKLKPKDKVEPKIIKKDVITEAKKSKKNKMSSELEKPADFDDGIWEEVPKKSDKKKVKGPEEKDKKESPNKKNKRKLKDNDIVEPAKPVIQYETNEENTIKVLSAEGPGVDEAAARALQAQVEELQRVLKEAERRDLGVSDIVEEEEVAELTDVKDLRSNKKKENKEKQNKKKATEVIANNNPVKSEDKESPVTSEARDEKAVPVFDELGDTWTDAKVSKKSKKKARKDQ